MNPIGGEIAIKQNNYHSHFTDSGRSSLRLFFRSNNYKNKKVLLPDFFCDIIEKVLQEENIKYEFYKVNNDFSINQKEINQKEFDILYIINYFGSVAPINNINLEDKILIEDNVFFVDFKNNHNAKQWFAFNSYRKITPLFDGSLIKTNLEINTSLIQNSQADFVTAKIEASTIKYNFLKRKKYSEQEYLNLFLKGEQMADNQVKIHTISSKSLFLLQNIDLKKDYKITKKRFKKMKKAIGFNKVKPIHFSFFTFEVKSKVNFINEMRKHNIYLPQFWQKTSKENSLYDELIAIPLFSNYSNKEFEFIYEMVLKNLNK